MYAQESHWGTARNLIPSVRLGPRPLLTMLRSLSVCSLIVLVAASSAHAQAFAPSKPVSSVSEVGRGLIVADVDQDGLEDLIGWSSSVFWHKNAGHGVFGIKRSLVNASGLYGVSAGDLDGDGDVDLMCSQDDGILSDGAFWIENLGAGVFSAAKHSITSTAKGADDVQAVDMDGDGDLDCVLVEFDAQSLGWYANDGNGLFGPKMTIGFSDFGLTFDTGDLDGDGDFDVVTPGKPKGQSVWLNDGSGGLGVPMLLPSTAQSESEVRIVDLDQDGVLDILATITGSGSVRWYRGLGAGTFSGEVELCNPGNSVATTLPVDVDLDGDLDLVTANNYPVASPPLVFINDGSTSFGAGLALGSTNARSDVEALDCDGDGDLDLIFANEGTDMVQFENLALIPSWTLDADGFEISLSAGGVQNLVLTTSQPGDGFLMLGTTAGTQPGLSSAGLTLPLNLSGAYALHTINQIGAPPLFGAFGVLSGAGTASASFQVPAGTSPSLVGTIVHHAVVTFSTTGTLTSTSNAVPVVMVP